MDLSPDEDNFQGRLLHQAALWDNVELLQELLTSGADIDSRDGCGRSCLHAAAVSEHSKCLPLLCERGAQLELSSDARQGGKTALHVAAERGLLSNVRVLCAAGADALARDASGATASELAARAGFPAVVAALDTHADAQERERLAQHSSLRALLAQGDEDALCSRLQSLSASATLVVNLTPAGANTLLYMAAEAGLAAAAAALLAAGADGRAHPATRYAPLHAAALRGHAGVARLLLQHFPEAVKLETVEKWLPLHAACMGGHAPMVALLLEYPYPEELLETFTDKSEQWQYRFAFDVNACDARAQPAVCLASAGGSLPALTALLNLAVPCELAAGEEDGCVMTEEMQNRVKKLLSPTKGGISMGIHAIVSRLSGILKPDQQESQKQLCPIRFDVGKGESCVALAARGNHAQCVAALLGAGAPANSRAKLEGEARGSRKSRSTSAPPPRRAGSPTARDRSNDRDSHYSALTLAVRHGNAALAQLLLAHGARDDAWQALRAAAASAPMHALIPAILNTKVSEDPENKVNRLVISRSILASGGGSLSHSARCPAVPVVLDWQATGALDHVRVSWLRSAALVLNPGVAPAAALHAVTRLDLSHNELRSLPHELFNMMSLVLLNVGQNKLDRLPAIGDSCEEEEDRKKGKRSSKTIKELYTAPALQELYLQDNRLESLPPELFSLPGLLTLDVSNNKLRHLPAELWASPSLKDLNASFNHLKDLPGRPAVSPTLPPASEVPARKPHRESTASELADVITVDRKLSVTQHAHSWASGGGVGRALGARRGRPAPGCPLAVLSLAHNQYTTVPAALACVAPNLTRLNMSYNSLRSMSYVTSYPKNIRQMDLSHNEITCWPSLPPLEESPQPGSPLHCCCLHKVDTWAGVGAGVVGGDDAPPPRASTYRGALLRRACPAKRHLTLHALRTLILSNNLLTRIQLTTDDDGSIDNEHENDNDDEDDWGSGTGIRSRLVFPQLSMLDMSSNALRSVPPAIQYLSNLCVFNINDNKEVTTLPASMGVLTRLWSISAVGCSLTDPLRQLFAGRCRSVEVISYLRSVLHEAKPYRKLKLMCVGQQGIGKTSLLECLRHESGLPYRRRHVDHWAVRMGNKVSTKNMSTVGVDIGKWTYEKQRSLRGPIHFRTWDFGGQQEYYATHQYFLSKRSLYLVVWKVTDGRKGLAGAINWLRSIQARAPGSPVIMVATHYDQVANSNLPENESPEMLQRIIRTSIMGAPDADKLGLPRVMDSLEVTCAPTARHNMRLLADIIYSVAYSVKPPGSKEPVLQQMVPASYLALEECVTHLAAELKDPVLRHDEYKQLVTQYMQQKNYRRFRDAAELHAATMFLHENGVLLHYDDATLRQLYFLRPQWLCDLLSHVVSVREVNPFVNNGIMKTEELVHVFKASPQLGGSEEASALALALLSKFELALCWQPRLLLVPPLLPEREPPQPQLPIKSREWTSKMARRWQYSPPELARADTSSPTLVDDSSPQITLTPRAGCPLRRVIVLSYVPVGLWARLCTRLVGAAPTSLPLYTTELPVDESISRALDLNWCWKLWKHGMKLVCGDVTLVAVVEQEAEWDDLLAMPGAPPGEGLRYRVRQDDVWSIIDADSSARIEITVPSQTCTVRRNDGKLIAGCQSITLEPNVEIQAKILALVSDQLDLLLEDWYPSLGTRFVHTSEGRSLITRLIPCPACLRDFENPPEEDQRELAQEFQKLEMDAIRPRVSQESRLSDADSGVGTEVPGLGSVEGLWPGMDDGRVVHAWTVEQATAAALTCKPVHCPKHGEMGVSGLAPDLMLLDIEESKRARWEHISRLATCGRGAFGTVLTAEWNNPNGQRVKVALKALQPVAPQTSDTISFQKYKIDLSRWQRAPCASAARAYSALRAESAVLRALRHPHALTLVAVCAAPAALLLPLAPQGALDGVLRKYQSAGYRVPPRVTRAVALQMARALEYLHAMRVLYRDLKSENVLVWEMPSPQESPAAELSAEPVNVFVKLGDYGISRIAPATGTKGFGGTEGFMAPEIMKYNGEEEYNEKVDCFSYGMLLYEMITLRQPFEGHEAVKEAILDGARPALSPREVQYPVCILETMRSCWNSAPELRPSAAALVSLCSAPEWCTLLDAVVARGSLAAAAVPVVLSDCSEGGWEVWSGGGQPERVHIYTVTRASVLAQQTVLVLPDKSESSVLVTSLCRVGACMWVGDSTGRVTVYSAATCSRLWSVHVTETCGGAMSLVIAMCHLSDMDRVALALSCGRLFLVTSERPDAASEGSFILTELGTSTQLSCLTARPDNGWQVWAGGSELSVYSVSGGAVRSAHTLPGVAGVAHLAPRPGGIVTYLDNGSTIYAYSSRRELTARLDCSRLVPCSETLDSISLDDQPPRNAVTCLCVVRSEVYAGTAAGAIIVADAATLRPLTVFRPHEEEIMSIVGLVPHAGVSSRHEEEPALLLTLGMGYRPLLQRYAPVPPTPIVSSHTVSYNSPFCLLWRAHHWLPD